jgi:hypothetical protein
MAADYSSLCSVCEEREATELEGGKRVCSDCKRTHGTMNEW